VTKRTGKDRMGSNDLSKWEHLCAVMDSNPAPTVAIDRSHRVVLWNRACQSLSGIPSNKVLGKPLDPKIFHQDQNKPALLDLVLDMDEKAIKEHYGDKNLSSSPTIPEAFEASDQLVVGGIQRALYFLAARIRDPQGKVIGAIETFHDNTEKEQLQRQLQHAQKMLALGTLAAGMAHEFNNILAAIRGYAQLMLLRAKADHFLSEHLQDIDESCQRAAKLIRKMLTFSRVDAGQKRPVKVNQVIEGVQRLLRQTFQPDISLKADLQGSLPFVMGEPNQLEQVILNLAVNARDAMPNGGEIRFVSRLVDLGEDFCRAHPWAKAGRYVGLHVEDTGGGMHQEVLDQVFEPFFTTKEPGRGTGLGLSIAYSIVKNHGGYIIAESEKGNGSCFRIYLPIMEEAVEEVLETPAGETFPRGNGQYVLVVDDEPKLREIVNKMLDSFGYVVTLAANGDEALLRYREAQQQGATFDLVILDLAMPVMDGETCLGHLLEIDPYARVLIVTGYRSEPADLRALQKKSKGILRKPFDLRTLLHGVKMALDT
jgi:two-component system cell cycle sensor histidine kinase/response regulator CckA